MGSSSRARSLPNDMASWSQSGFVGGWKASDRACLLETLGGLIYSVFDGFIWFYRVL